MFNEIITLTQKLLERPEVNPGAMDNQAIQLAAAQGHTDVVTLLLQRSDVNPGAADNEAIRVATAHGHSDVVTALLARPEVNLYFSKQKKTPFASIVTYKMNRLLSTLL